MQLIAKTMYNDYSSPMKEELTSWGIDTKRDLQWGITFFLRYSLEEQFWLVHFHPPMRANENRKKSKEVLRQEGNYPKKKSLRRDLPWSSKECWTKVESKEHKRVDKIQEKKWLKDVAKTL
jgi:hypothetical protein